MYKFFLMHIKVNSNGIYLKYKIFRSTLQELLTGFGTHTFTVSSPWEERSTVFFAAEAIYIVPVHVPPGTHY